MRIPLAAAVVVWAAVAVGGRLVADQARQTEPRQAAVTPYPGVLDEHPAIQYAKRPTHDSVTRLSEAIASGRASLTFRQDSGYFRSVLEALKVPLESQVLVFSKTGIQGGVTGPANPRALYYSPSVVVGYIAGARFLEIASHDREQGVVFYTVDQQ